MASEHNKDTNMNTRNASEVTTHELVLIIAADADTFDTFEARSEYTLRTGLGWIRHAPANPRMTIQGCRWHDFVETGTMGTADSARILHAWIIGTMHLALPEREDFMWVHHLVGCVGGPVGPLTLAVEVAEACEGRAWYVRDMGTYRRLCAHHDHAMDRLLAARLNVSPDMWGGL